MTGNGCTSLTTWKLFIATNGGNPPYQFIHHAAQSEFCTLMRSLHSQLYTCWLRLGGLCYCLVLLWIGTDGGFFVHSKASTAELDSDRKKATASS